MTPEITDSTLWMMETPEAEDYPPISHQRAPQSLQTAPCEGHKAPPLIRGALIIITTTN